MLVQLDVYKCQFHFSAGTDGKKNDTIASTSDSISTRGKGEVDEDSSCVPSTSASISCSKEQPVVQSICSVPVETTDFIHSGDNSSTQPTEVSASVWRGMLSRSISRLKPDLVTQRLQIPTGGRMLHSL